jgi:ABC transporter substrate binding protein (PQQ-dependent alcohol dehydrogenase system)
LIAVLLAPTLVVGADFTIGYLELKGDPRYGSKRIYARYLGQALGRPYPGAEVALKEVKFHGAAVGATFTLERVRGEDAAELAAGVDRLKAEQGAQFFVVDAPAAIIEELGELTKDKDVMLFNVSARDDRLRQSQCQPHVFHIIPSYAMAADALTQYLTSKKWKEVLILEGPEPEDQALAAAFERAAKRYGLDIVDRRSFVLSNDPRQREQNNIALLTAGSDYQTVYVADTNGEFARGVPYQTVKPQLVVGTEGLAATAWHWAWERHGAPQLEKRFQKAAKRPMTGVDWSAWMAVKAVADAVQRTGSTEFEALANYIRSDETILDGFKGNRLNFRLWNNQLRQPMLLVTHNWVVDRAPLDGFLHRTNDMDTLGLDQNQSDCNF